MRHDRHTCQSQTEQATNMLFVSSMQILGLHAHAAKRCLQLIGDCQQTSVVEALTLSLSMADSIEELQQLWLRDNY